MTDPKTSPCFGRGRTLRKIARWHGMDSTEQRAFVAELPQRMANTGLLTIATDPERV